LKPSRASGTSVTADPVTVESAESANGKKRKRWADAGEIGSHIRRRSRRANARNNGTDYEAGRNREGREDREGAGKKSPGLERNTPAFVERVPGNRPEAAATTLKRRLLDAPKPLQCRHVRGSVSDILVDRGKAVIAGPPTAIRL